MDYLELFSEHLFEVMKIRGISKSELAERLGTSPTALTILARRSSSPTLKTMQLFSEGIGIPLSIMLQPSDSEAWKTVIAMLMFSHSGRLEDAPQGFIWFDKSAFLPTHKAAIVEDWMREAEKEITITRSKK